MATPRSVALLASAATAAGAALMSIFGETPLAITTPTISRPSTMAVAAPSHTCFVKPLRMVSRSMSSIITTNRNSTITAPT
jgi:hypothetical protein